LRWCDAGPMHGVYYGSGWEEDCGFWYVLIWRELSWGRDADCDCGYCRDSIVGDETGEQRDLDCLLK
jgi:hypothetical protein